jgi:glutamate formiminotransferase
VVNISEARRTDRLAVVARAAGRELLDLHTDLDHNRSVLTVVEVPAAQAVVLAATMALDLADHEGVHPRLGVADVVPFVPLGESTMADAVAARDDMARWVGDELGVPCFVYGPERSLPEIRRRAFVDLAPDTGPDRPHPSAGACCVGARPPLVAYNLWLSEPDLGTARTIAADLRSPAVRALGLAVGADVQVSINLVDPLSVGPADVYDAVAARTGIARAELVGLIPGAVLERIDPTRWSALDVSEDRTIEHRLTAHGFSTEDAG